jgi:pyridinium-3,5-bisthiocarboxylic acid mononucleotide nickel chelatase
MSKTLYLECYSGISGDMTAAALIDLGADKEAVLKALNSLDIDGYEINISRIKKAGLDVCDFNVILDKEHTGCDHGQRGLPEMLDIIKQANITARAKETAIRILTIIAKAEAKTHGMDLIIDIIAVAVCLDNLDITEVIVPVLYEGHGFVRRQQGALPIPVPAVAFIASSYGLALHITGTEGELVTLTGAGIAAAIKTSDKLPEKFSIEKIGVGAGKRIYDRPSILRAMLIKEKTSEKGCIYKLESNIDDCTGEALGYVMERLFAAGAGDVHFMPVYMKKNRPAYQLNVICREDDIKKLENIIFEETTTIGIRRVRMESTVLKKDIENIRTTFGEAQVKVCELESGKRIYPEYESVVELCKKHQISYKDMFQLIQKEYQNTK